MKGKGSRIFRSGNWRRGNKDGRREGKGCIGLAEISKKLIQR